MNATEISYLKQAKITATKALFLHQTLLLLFINE